MTRGRQAWPPDPERGVPGPDRRGLPTPGSQLPPPRWSGSFTERVMARVAEEPTPTPARVFLRSLRHLAMRDALAALATAWRLAFEPESRVPTSARATAAAMFLSVVVLFGVGGAFVAGGALALLGPDAAGPARNVPAAVPSDTPAVIELSPSPSPSPSPTPRPTPPVTKSPSAAERADSEADDTSERAAPSKTEAPPAVKVKRETPEPKETPQPKERDDGDKKSEDDGGDD